MRGATRVLCDANAVWRKFDTENAETLAKSNRPCGRRTRMNLNASRSVSFSRRENFRVAPETRRSVNREQARFRARRRFGVFSVENIAYQGLVSLGIVTPRVGWLHYRYACLRASQPLSEALIFWRMDRGWEVRSGEVVTRAPTSRSFWCDESFVRRQCRMA